MESIAETVHLRLRKIVKLPAGTPVYLKTIARYQTIGSYKSRLDRILLSLPDTDKSAVLFDIVQVITHVQSLYPHLVIEHYGEPQTLVLFEKPNPPSRIWWLVMVWLLLFMGSGLAIMNFHADVSMAEVHRNLYHYMTGIENDHPLWLQIPYSFGVGLGMVLFFNRIFKRKINDEPDPLELEMFNYQESIYLFQSTEELQKLSRDEETP